MTKPSHTSNDTTLAWLGGAIALVGLVLLFTTNRWLGFSGRTIWPLFVMLPGLAMLLLGLRLRSVIARIPLIFLGSMQVLLALFFFTFTSGLIAWSAMRNIWPVFVLIPGLALLVAYYANDKKPGVLFTAGNVLSIGALAATLLSLISGSRFAWPVLIIVIGAALVISPLLKRNSHDGGH